jgi:hypothetical protein
MLRVRLLVVAAVFLLGTWVRAADEPPPLGVAQGPVEKADKDSLTIRPRKPDGKFDKSVVLKVTGTTKITTLAPQTRAGKEVMTQKETEAKDLQANQSIAVIYATGKEGAILLSAVVQPPKEK